ncbi:Transcriptional activator protein DAL81 [Ceratocystis fimbriata CBS 114723]|uniref:Transcriptional activator protein DAL81 n=1 Tax=Ceratocystis fimbriata CBS 114723 TaxID=1035309 RepID=A0A2C5WZ36_9PEZI|nr:Transcriptional activator protein DAL81 [Ceratocystis fimbriata CBS 114723]
MSTHGPRTVYHDMAAKQHHHHHHHQTPSIYALPLSQFTTSSMSHQTHLHSQAQLHGHPHSSNSNMMYSFLPADTPSSAMAPLARSAQTPVGSSPTSSGASASPSSMTTPAYGMGVPSTSNMAIDMGMNMGISEQPLSTSPSSMSQPAPLPSSQPVSQPTSSLQRASRPCDTCRVRKTRCVRQNNASQCILCAFHNKQCTYLRGPPPRGSATTVTRHKNKEKTRAAKGQAKAPQASACVSPTRVAVTSASPSASPTTPALTVASTAPSNESTASQDTSSSESELAIHSEASSKTNTNANSNANEVFDLDSPSVTGSPEGNVNESDYDRYMSILKGEYRSSPSSPESLQSPQSMPSDSASNTQDSPLSSDYSSPKLIPLLSGTLGLSLATHPEYIGPTSHREPVLLDLQRYDINSPTDYPTGSDPSPASSNSAPAPVARRINDRTMFLIYPDDNLASEGQRIAHCDAVEACVRPLGKALVDLYFRIVHPSYPILHKKSFLPEYAISHRCFTPSLLAAVYLIALDYQLYDPNMASGIIQLENPNGPADLEALVERTLVEDLKRPKISTLQAGLLLLQRHRPNGVSSNWMFTAQIVALAQGLGLHVDCSAWEIPEWEKGLRRRLGWALYLQDRWGVFSHGRLRLLSDQDWDLQPCSSTDFPESSAIDEDPAADGNIEVDSGRQQFIKQAELAGILNQVMGLFYTSSATKPGGSLDRMGVVQAVEMARPVMVRLREWRNSLPAKLQLDCIEDRKLSANGSLHLAIAATEAALHRALVRLLTSTSPPDLVNAVRSAATNRVLGAINLLKSLRPEHLGAFWNGASAHQVAIIGSLAGLLWATSVDEAEIQWRKSMMMELRWVLRVRGQTNGFIREALRVLEKDLGHVGDKM